MIETKYLRKCPLCHIDERTELRTLKGIKLCRCKKCSLVYADVTQLEVEQFNNYPKDKFFIYIQQEPVFTLAYYQFILERIEQKFKTKNIKILDFGCGAGFFMRVAKMLDFKVKGIDFSPYSELARDTFGLDIEITSIFDFKIEDEYFDVIISHATHEHLYELKAISEELVKKLKTGGILIISGIPNYNSLTIKVFNSFYNNYPPGHINYFEKKSIQYLYHQLGLEVVYSRSYGMNFWVIYYSLINFFKTKKSQEKQEIKTNKIDFSITHYHKMISKIYINTHLPTMGESIEIWGIKK